MFLNTSSTNGFYAKKHFGYPIDFVSIPDEMRALSMALNITCNVTWHEIRVQPQDEQLGLQANDPFRFRHHTWLLEGKASQAT